MNRKTRDVIIGILIFSFFTGMVVWLYNRESGMKRRDLERHMRELSPMGGVPQGDNLLKAIQLYEAQIELNIRDGAQAGAYWKILARRFADRGMHVLALEALENAIKYNAEDPALFAWTGDSAFVVARSIVDANADSIAEKQRYYKMAEDAYRRSIELDPDYARPRHGIGELYTRDLGRPLDAISHLERYHLINPNDISGMDLLAEANFLAARETSDVRRSRELNDRAIALYDQIILRSNNQEDVMEAARIREIIRNN